MARNKARNEPNLAWRPVQKEWAKGSVVRGKLLTMTTEEDLRWWLDRALTLPRRFARTMPWCPHSYVVRDKMLNGPDFAELTEEFLTTWPRPSVPDQGPEYLVPILDVQKKPGWYKGWRTEFEYVRFQDEIWEVRDIKTLFNRVFKHLWATRRPEVLAHGASPRGPIFETEEWKGQWDTLGPTHCLFMGMFPQYMLGDMQRILDELDLADEVFVKYSSD